MASEPAKIAQNQLRNAIKIEQEQNKTLTLGYVRILAKRNKIVIPSVISQVIVSYASINKWLSEIVGNPQGGSAYIHNLSHPIV